MYKNVNCRKLILKTFFIKSKYINGLENLGIFLSIFGIDFYIFVSYNQFKDGGKIMTDVMELNDLLEGVTVIKRNGKKLILMDLKQLLLLKKGLIVQKIKKMKEMIILINTLLKIFKKYMEQY